MPEHFFPGSKLTRFHKKFCTGDAFENGECPVIRQCRNYAIVHEETGIWGGTSKAERSKIGNREIIEGMTLAKALREQYAVNHLLEYRPGNKAVTDFAADWANQLAAQQEADLENQEQQAALLQEQISPISVHTVSLDSKSTQSISA